MDSPNGTQPVTAPNPTTAKHFPLNTKQTKFFQGQKNLISQIDTAMKGALQLIVEENDIKATKLQLSEDCTELLIEE